MSNTEEKKIMERPEIQAALETVINAELDTLGIRIMGDLDEDHARRTIRALVRLGANLAIAKGVPPTIWMAVAGECYAKECGLDKATTQEEAQAILAGKLAGSGSGN